MRTEAQKAAKAERQEQRQGNIKRKNDTRMKVIIGGAFMAQLEEYPELKPVLLTVLKRIDRPQDIDIANKVIGELESDL